MEKFIILLLGNITGTLIFYGLRLFMNNIFRNKDR